MKKHAGFSLIAALFVMVVLSSVAGFAISIAGMTRNTAVFSLQGVRGYFAARSGLEWGLYTISNNPAACPASTTLNLTQAGLQGFSVLVTCSVSTHTEDTNNMNVFVLNAVASKGSLGSSDYVTREMQISAILPS